MKVNKKAILGMFVAMVMSLGIMGGFNMKSNKDVSLQQIGLGAAVVNDVFFEGNSQTVSYISNYAGNVSAGMAVGGAAAAALSTTNPVGWGYWATTAAIGL